MSVFVLLAGVKCRFLVLLASVWSVNQVKSQFCSKIKKDSIFNFWRKEKWRNRSDGQKGRKWQSQCAWTASDVGFSLISPIASLCAMPSPTPPSPSLPLPLFRFNSSSPLSLSKYTCIYKYLCTYSRWCTNFWNVWSFADVQFKWGSFTFSVSALLSPNSSPSLLLQLCVYLLISPFFFSF